MDPDRFAHIEVLLSVLLTGMRDEYTKEEMREIDGFFDHGEYGLALETAAAMLKPNPSITPEQRKLIGDLAKHMGMLEEPLIAHFLDPKTRDTDQSL